VRISKSLYAASQPSAMAETDVNRMTLRPPNHDGYSRRAVSLTALLTCLLAGLSFPADAEDNSTESANPDDLREQLFVLDGLAFEGEIGEIGGTPFSRDVWMFENGMFVSRRCGGCGKGEYWLRPEDGGIRFRADKDCAGTTVTLSYTGLVKGDRIEGTFTWTKDRWYGDIEEQFRFEGKRIGEAELAAFESDPPGPSCGESPLQAPSEAQRTPSSVDRFMRFP